MKKTIRAFIAFAALACLITTAPAQRKEFERPVRHAIRGTRGAVATGSDAAAEAGMRLYFKGGTAVDAGVAALREYGTKSFADVIAPAIEFAEGMPIDEMRAGSIERGRRFFELWPSSKRVFMPGGRAPQPGEIFRQPDLARTMRSMMEA